MQAMDDFKQGMTVQDFYFITNILANINKD